MKRRIFSIITALALCLSLLPPPALAAEALGSGTADDPWLCGPEGNESSVTAVLADGTLTVSGSGPMANYNELTSPWMNTGASIPITKVVIDSGVTGIGKFAFSGLVNVTEVSIPEGVTSIGNYAFINMAELTQVTIPSTMENVGLVAFGNCTKLSEVTLLGRSTGISSYTFTDGTVNTFHVPCGTKTFYEQKLTAISGFTIEEASHTPDSGGACTGCGLQFEALTRVDGGETFYPTVTEAFDAANKAGTAAVTLLADAALPDGAWLTVEEGKTITLDCGNYTLSGSYGSIINVGGTLNFTGGTVRNTCTDSMRGCINVNAGGTFTMSGGTLTLGRAGNLAVSVSGGVNSLATVTISGGSVGVGTVGLNIGAYTTVRLSGGTYGDIKAGSENESLSPETSAITVRGLLAGGCAFYGEDGQPVALAEKQHTLDGTVTVKECTHIYEYTQTEGAETHSKTCPACGDAQAAEDCVFKKLYQ